MLVFEFVVDVVQVTIARTEPQPNAEMGDHRSEEEQAAKNVHGSYQDEHVAIIRLAGPDPKKKPDGLLGEQVRWVYGLDARTGQ
jgi:hypothetical protein